MGKLRDKFKQLRQKNQKAFIPYVTFGFPTLELSKDILFTLQAAGADIIEIGMPFSDPIADGPTIQAASRIALNQGANLELLFDFLENYKKYFTIPLIIMRSKSLSPRPDKHNIIKGFFLNFSFLK